MSSLLHQTLHDDSETMGMGDDLNLFEQEVRESTETIKEQNKQALRGNHSSMPKQKKELIYFVQNQVSTYAFLYPRACAGISCTGILLVILMLSSVIINPTEEYGISKEFSAALVATNETRDELPALPDVTDILEHNVIEQKSAAKSPIITHTHTKAKAKAKEKVKPIPKVDFGLQKSLKNVKDWCLGKRKKDCECEDPLVPVPRTEYSSWVEAMRNNRLIVKRYRGTPLDVLLLGESIFEVIDGRWMGRKGRSKGLNALETIFDEHFDTDIGAKVKGIALGIAGDSAPNLLWRIIHGELPHDLNPKVIWISLGNNDIGRMKCSEEITVLGILRVVEEILNRKPHVRVVINSLFPMTTVRGGVYPIISDYQDAVDRRLQYDFGERLDNDDPVEEQGLDWVFDELLDIYGPSKFEIGTSQRRILRSNERRRQEGIKTTKHKMTEEEKAAATEKEEEARDKEGKKKYKTKEKFEPVLADQSKIHKYKPGTAFLRKTTLPLWASINAINKELEKFAHATDRVYYFDSSAVFVKSKKKKLVLRSEHISNRGHPTIEGFTMWEDGIVARLQHILTEMREDQPELFIDVEHDFDLNITKEILEDFEWDKKEGLLDQEIVLPEDLEDNDNRP